MPSGLVIDATSASTASLTWQAASDNVGVTAYRVLRDGVTVGSTGSTSFADAGLAPSSSYRYAVVALDAAGNVSAASTSVEVSTPAADPNVVHADPTDYLVKLAALRPGDTLMLAPGNYGVDASGNDTADVPGLPIFGLNGTSDAPITITGPDSGPLPVLLGRATHNTVRISGSSHVIVRRLEIDNRDRGAPGVAAQGTTHHITLEDLYIHGVGDHQQTVGIAANSAPSWNWVVRRNRIVGAGTGMYFGSSDGSAPFVAGLIEHNLVRDTIGYSMQVKHQNVWSSVPAGMPTGPTTTVIRHNVFSKLSSFVSSDGARPNLLVGDQPTSGPGAANGFEIYGNFFYQNPTEALFQGEGNIAFHDNLLVNDAGPAINIQRHMGSVRAVRIFSNTIVAGDGGIRVSGGQAGSMQRVHGNAVFAASPISISGADAIASANVTGSRADAATFLVNPGGAPGSLDLYPKSGQLQGAALDTSGLGAYADWDRDFNGATRDWTVRGAYAATGSNPGWLPWLEIKP